MSPAFFAVVLIKTIWMHGVLSDPEPFKWIRLPEASVTVKVEPNMAECLKDGAKWRFDAIKAAFQSQHMDQVPLDAISFKCALILEGGIDT